MSGDGDFLARWSRRKRSHAERADAASTRPHPAAPASGVVGSANPAPDHPTEPQAEPAAAAEAPEERSDADILAALGLRHPDEMQAGDDFGAFLRVDVPEHLRRLALRKLWRSNPVLACVDGLNDYDGDFTNAVTDAPGVQTAYEVGKGIVRQMLEQIEAPDTPGDAASPPVKTASDGASHLSLASQDGADMQNASASRPAPASAPPHLDDGDREIAGHRASGDAGQGANDPGADDPRAPDAAPSRPRRMAFRFTDPGGDAPDAAK